MRCRQSNLNKEYNVIGRPGLFSEDILDVEVFLKAAEILFEIAKKFKNLEFIDFGSGFKVPYKEGDISTNIEELGKKLSQRFNNFCKEYGKDLTLAFEPGKFLMPKLAASSGYWMFPEGQRNDVLAFAYKSIAS